MSTLLALPGLEDYNTRMVVLGTALLGLACGPVGTFLLLRKRSLLSDTLAHATLPGIASAFLLSLALGGSGKELSFLLTGATIMGVLGCLCVIGIRSNSKIKDDAAMGIVLGVFFSAGIVLMGLIQSHPQGSSAGLMSFIYGKTASMVMQDVQIMAVMSVLAITLTALFYKELQLLCFDAAYAKSIGWGTLGWDVLLIGLAALLTVAGLQAVGLILIIAFLILPAAASQYLSKRLWIRLWASAFIGAASGWIGALISNTATNLPAGAIIVLTASFFFALLFLLGPAGGVLPRVLALRRQRRKTRQQHLLRALYEMLEVENQLRAGHKLPVAELTKSRSWSFRELSRALHEAQRMDYVYNEGGRVGLTSTGFVVAERFTRNHRLWEVYLMEFADVARNHVDRDADTVEHVLGTELVRQLEERVGTGDRPIPPSPHDLAIKA